MLRIAWLGTYIQTQHDDHEDVVGQGDVDLVHDQDIVLSEARLALDIGLTKQLGASLVVPVRVVSTSIRYLAKSDGSEVDLVNPGIHHRNETLAGIADPMLLGSFTTPIRSMRATLRAGFTIPIGRTEDNPFTPDAETMKHQHVQFGSGTVSPVVAADVAWSTGAWRIGGFALAQQSIYTNSRGFKAGDRYAAGIAVSRRLAKQWSLRGGLQVQGETAEHWEGVEHTDDGNRGRFDAMFAAGGSYAATDRLSIDVAIKVPFITEAVGGQLDMPAIVEVGGSWRFGNAPRPAHHHDEHDHDHEHADHDRDHDHEHEPTDHDHEHEGHAHEQHGDERHDHEGHDHDHATQVSDVDAPRVAPNVDEPGVDKFGGDKTGGDKPGGDKPGVDKPGVDRPGGDKPGGDKPGVDKFGGDRPGGDKPGAKPGVDKPKPPAIKVDVADYAKNGDAPDLVPVRGKVTIFDFWATWCGPCKTLDSQLVEIARRHPALVAIRKLDVVDWDSKAAERYLTPGGFNLPHLKIYDAAGKRVLEKSSDAGKLSALVEQVLAIVEAEAKKQPVAKPKATRIEIKADTQGFTPAAVTVPRGVPVTFTFERRAEKSCASEVIFEVDGKKIETQLPVGKRVEVTLTFATPGPVAFHCAMNMFRGTVTVE